MIKKKIWDNEIPVKIVLDSKEIAVLNEVDPLYVRNFKDKY